MEDKLSREQQMLSNLMEGEELAKEQDKFDAPKGVADTAFESMKE